MNASLGRRLLLGAGVFITAALVVAAILISFVLHRFVQGQIDQRLDSQIIPAKARPQGYRRWVLRSSNEDGH